MPRVCEWIDDGIWRSLAPSSGSRDGYLCMRRRWEGAQIVSGCKQVRDSLDGIRAGLRLEWHDVGMAEKGWPEQQGVVRRVKGVTGVTGNTEMDGKGGTAALFIYSTARIGGGDGV